MINFFSTILKKVATSGTNERPHPDDDRDMTSSINDQMSLAERSLNLAANVFGELFKFTPLARSWIKGDDDMQRKRAFDEDETHMDTIAIPHDVLIDESKRVQSLIDAAKTSRVLNNPQAQHPISAIVFAIKSAESRTQVCGVFNFIHSATSQHSAGGSFFSDFYCANGYILLDDMLERVERIRNSSFPGETKPVTAHKSLGGNQDVGISGHAASCVSDADGAINVSAANKLSESSQGPPQEPRVGSGLTVGHDIPDCDEYFSVVLKGILALIVGSINAPLDKSTKKGSVGGGVAVGLHACTISNIMALELLTYLANTRRRYILMLVCRISFVLVKAYPIAIVSLEALGVVDALCASFVRISLLGEADFMDQYRSVGGACISSQQHQQQATVDTTMASSPATPLEASSNSLAVAPPIDLVVVLSDLVATMQLFAIATSCRDVSILSLLCVLAVSLSLPHSSPILDNTQANALGQYCVPAGSVADKTSAAPESPLCWCRYCEAESATIECLDRTCRADGYHLLCSECDRVYHKVSSRRSHTRAPRMDIHAPEVRDVIELILTSKTHSGISRAVNICEQVLFGFPENSLDVSNERDRVPVHGSFILSESALAITLGSVRDLLDDRRSRSQGLPLEYMKLFIHVLKSVVTSEVEYLPATDPLLLHCHHPTVTEVLNHLADGRSNVSTVHGLEPLLATGGTTIPHMTAAEKRTPTARRSATPAESSQESLNSFDGVGSDSSSCTPAAARRVCISLLIQNISRYLVLDLQSSVTPLVIGIGSSQHFSNVDEPVGQAASGRTVHRGIISSSKTTQPCTRLHRKYCIDTFSRLGGDAIFSYLLLEKEETTEHSTSIRVTTSDRHFIVFTLREAILTAAEIDSSLADSLLEWYFWLVGSFVREHELYRTIDPAASLRGGLDSVGNTPKKGTPMRPAARGLAGLKQHREALGISDEDSHILGFSSSRGTEPPAEHGTISLRTRFFLVQELRILLESEEDVAEEGSDGEPDALSRWCVRSTIPLARSECHADGGSLRHLADRPTISFRVATFIPQLRRHLCSLRMTDILRDLLLGTRCDPHIFEGRALGGLISPFSPFKSPAAVPAAASLSVSVENNSGGVVPLSQLALCDWWNAFCVLWSLLLNDGSFSKSEMPEDAKDAVAELFDLLLSVVSAVSEVASYRELDLASPTLLILQRALAQMLLDLSITRGRVTKPFKPFIAAVIGDPSSSAVPTLSTAGSVFNHVSSFAAGPIAKSGDVSNAVLSSVLWNFRVFESMLDFESAIALGVLQTNSSPSSEVSVGGLAAATILSPFYFVRRNAVVQMLSCLHRFPMSLKLSSLSSIFSYFSLTPMTSYSNAVSADYHGRLDSRSLQEQAAVSAMSLGNISRRRSESIRSRMSNSSFNLLETGSLVSMHTAENFMEEQESVGSQLGIFFESVVDSYSIVGSRRSTSNRLNSALPNRQSPFDPHPSSPSSSVFVPVLEHVSRSRDPGSVPFVRKLLNLIQGTLVFKSRLGLKIAGDDDDPPSLGTYSESGAGMLELGASAASHYANDDVPFNREGGVVKEAADDVRRTRSDAYLVEHLRTQLMEFVPPRQNNDARYFNYLPLPSVRGEDSATLSIARQSFHPNFNHLMLRTPTAAATLAALALSISDDGNKRGILTYLCKIMEGNSMGTDLLTNSFSTSLMQVLSTAAYSEQPWVGSLVNLLSSALYLNFSDEVLKSLLASLGGAPDVFVSGAGDQICRIRDIRAERIHRDRALQILCTAAKRRSPTDMLHFDQSSPLLSGSGVTLPVCSDIPPPKTGFTICSWICVGDLANRPVTSFFQLSSCRYSDNRVVMNAFFRTVYTSSASAAMPYSDGNCSPRISYDSLEERGSARSVQLCLSYAKVLERIESAESESRGGYSRETHIVPIMVDLDTASARDPMCEAGVHASSSLISGDDTVKLTQRRIGNWREIVSQLFASGGGSITPYDAPDPFNEDAFGNGFDSLDSAQVDVSAYSAVASSLARHSVPDFVVDFEFEEAVGGWHMVCISQTARGLTCHIDGEPRTIKAWTPTGYVVPEDHVCGRVPPSRGATGSDNARDASASTVSPCYLQPSLMESLSLRCSLGHLHVESSSYQRLLVGAKHISSPSKTLPSLDDLFSSEIRGVKYTQLLIAHDSVVGGLAGLIGGFAIVEGVLDTYAIQTCYDDGPSPVFPGKKLVGISLDSGRDSPFADGAAAAAAALTASLADSKTAKGTTAAASLSYFRSLSPTSLGISSSFASTAPAAATTKDTTTTTNHSTVAPEDKAPLTAAVSTAVVSKGLFSLPLAEEIRSGAARKYRTNRLADTLQSVGGLGILLPQLTDDPVTQVAILRIIFDLAFLTKEESKKFLQSGLDKAILFCCGSVSMSSDALKVISQAMVSNSFGYLQPRMSRPFLLPLLLDIALVHYQRPMLARSAIDWLVESCVHTRLLSREVIDTVGFTPVLILLSAWHIVELKLVTARGEVVVVEKATDNTAVVDAVSGDGKVESSGGVGPVSLAAALRQQRKISSAIGVSALHSSSEAAAVKNGSEGDPELATVRLEISRLQIGCGKLLKQLLGVSSSSPSALTESGFTTTHFLSLFSFIPTALQLQIRSLGGDLAAIQNMSILSKIARNSSSLNDSASSAQQQTLALDAAVIALDSIISLNMDVSPATVLKNMLKSTLPNQGHWSVILYLAGLPFVEVRSRAVSLLAITLAKLDGYPDAKLIAAFEKMNGFSFLAEQLSVYAAEESVVTQLLNIFFWRQPLHVRPTEAAAPLDASMEAAPSSNDGFKFLRNLTPTASPLRRRGAQSSLMSENVPIENGVGVSVFGPGQFSAPQTSLRGPVLGLVRDIRLQEMGTDHSLQPVAEFNAPAEHVPPTDTGSAAVAAVAAVAPSENTASTLNPSPQPPPLGLGIMSMFGWRTGVKGQSSAADAPRDNNNNNSEAGSEVNVQQEYTIDASDKGTASSVPLNDSTELLGPASSRGDSVPVSNSSRDTHSSSQSLANLAAVSSVSAGKSADAGGRGAQGTQSVGAHSANNSAAPTPSRNYTSKSAVERIEVPQIFQAVFRLLKNSKSPDLVSFVMRDIESSSLDPWLKASRSSSPTEGAGFATASPATLPDTTAISAAAELKRAERNAESIFGQRDWLIHIAECVLAFRTKQSSDFSKRGADESQDSAMLDYGNRRLSVVSEAESVDNNNNQQQQQAHTESVWSGDEQGRARSQSNSVSGQSLYSGPGSGLGGSASASHADVLFARFAGPLFQFVQAMLFEDMKARPGSTRRWNEVLRLSTFALPETYEPPTTLLSVSAYSLGTSSNVGSLALPTADLERQRWIQREIVSDLLICLENFPLETKASSLEVITNVLRNFALFLEQLLEKVHLDLDFCVRVVLVVHGLTYKSPQEIRVRLRDTNLPEVRNSYIVRCLMDAFDSNNGIVFARAYALSRINASLQGYISLSDTKMLMGHHVLLYVLSVFVEAVDDLEAISNLEINFIASSEASLLLARVEMLVESINLLIEVVQTCIHMTPDCRKCISKLAKGLPGDKFDYVLSALLNTPFGTTHPVDTHTDGTVSPKSDFYAPGFRFDFPAILNPPPPPATPLPSVQSVGVAASSTVAEETKAAEFVEPMASLSSLAYSSKAPASTLAAPTSTTSWWGSWVAGTGIAMASDDSAIEQDRRRGGGLSATFNDSVTAFYSIASAGGGGRSGGSAKVASDLLRRISLKDGRDKDTAYDSREREGGQPRPASSSIASGDEPAVDAALYNLSAPGTPPTTTVGISPVPYDISSFLVWFCSVEQRQVQDEFRARLLKEVKPVLRTTEKLHERTLQRRQKHERALLDKLLREKATQDKSSREAVKRSREVCEKLATQSAAEFTAWGDALSARMVQGQSRFAASVEASRKLADPIQSNISSTVFPEFLQSHFSRQIANKDHVDIFQDNPVANDIKNVDMVHDIAPAAPAPTDAAITIADSSRDLTSQNEAMRVFKFLRDFFNNIS